MISSIPSPVIDELHSRIGPVREFSISSGGCINHGGRLTTASATFFLKWNYAERFPDMFSAEAKGLALLKQAGALRIPNVVCAGVARAFQFLLMEYIEEGVKSENYWNDFARGLAALHRNQTSRPGLDHDNYIGSLPQINGRLTSWVEFFIERRLSVQLQRAVDRGRINKATEGKFEVLLAKLPSLLPEEPPSLLHGDLWSGNVMVTSGGEPCLIDPAVYFGHREMDIAMTQLFGGFGADYLDRYNEIFPLMPGYQERLELYNLYPLLVHVNLFGGGYRGQVEQVLRKFV